MIAWTLAACVWLSPSTVADEIARLEGHRVTVSADESDAASAYAIEDIAGEGKPIVGVVERRGRALWLGEYRLIGPLARPRIAGPGYKVWVIGETAGNTLRARRIGILAPPRR